MEKSFWANDNPVKPVKAARQATTSSSRSESKHSRPDTDVFQSSSAFQRPQSQPFRMADPNPGPMLHNPAVAAQMGGLNRSMTQASSRNAPPRSRTTITSSNQSLQPPPRPDSALGFKPAPLANTTTPYASHQPATARSPQAPPTNTVDKPASTPISTSSATMPSRAVPHHHRKGENKQPTLRVPSPDGEQWRSQKDNKFMPFLDHVETYDRKGKLYTAEDENMLLEHTGTRNSNRFSDDANDYTDLDAPSDFEPGGPTLSYGDYAEPKAPSAPVSTTTHSSSNAIKTTQEEIPKAHEEQKEQQEEQDAKLARKIEEREAREDAARVTEEQEKAERAVERSRQRYEDEVHGRQDQATPVAPSTASQSDTAAQLAAALDELVVLTEDLSKTEALLQKGQNRAVKIRDNIDVKLEQVHLLRRQQLIEVQLNSAD